MSVASQSPSAAPEQVQGVGGGFDDRAVENGVFHQLLQQRLRLKVEEIVRAEEDKGDKDCDKALIFQLQADFCHDPAEQTRQHQHEQGDQHRQKDGADQRGDGKRRDNQINDDRGDDDDTGVHQPHQVNAQQPRGDDIAHGNRHGQQLVVVLGEVQTGIGVEHAAEGAEKHRQQRKQREIQPAEVKRDQRVAHHQCEEGEDTAQYTDH